MKKPRAVRISCTCLLIGSIAMLGWTTANGGIIDTRPRDTTLNFGASNTGGGSFVADDNNLASFTLDLSDPGGGGIYRAIVMDIGLGGVPGTVLWESADFSLSSVVTEFIFTPNVALGTGNEYFVGLDSGLRTAAAGGNFVLGFRVGGAVDVLVGGQGYQDLNDGNGFTGSGTLFDIASRIEMTSVPLPATAWLFGSGLLSLAGMARRRKAA